MRIAIIDDERPARSELAYQLREICPDAVIEEGDCGAKALELAGAYQFEIIFLDINLGDINGTALVNALYKMQDHAQIVFVTAYDQYAVKAFELNVADYIMKPLRKDRLRRTVDKCLNQINSLEEAAAFKKRKEEPRQRRISINLEGKVVFLDMEQIVYVETYNRGSFVHTMGGDYVDTKSIGDYEKRLPGDKFFRIHKSYLVNVDQIKELFPWGGNTFGLRMKGFDEVLSVGREKMKMLRQILGVS